MTKESLQCQKDIPKLRIILRHDEKDIKKEKRSMRQERILLNCLHYLIDVRTFIPNKIDLERNCFCFPDLFHLE